MTALLNNYYIYLVSIIVMLLIAYGYYYVIDKEIDKSKRNLDPVKHCKVYKANGCAHVDGFMCNMKTCNISVTVVISPTSIKTITPNPWGDIDYET